MPDESTPPPETEAPPAQPTTPPPAAESQPPRSGIDTKAIESTLVEAGQTVEAAARQLGEKIDRELLDNETGREVKQEVSSLWGRIKEKIQ